MPSLLRRDAIRLFEASIESLQLAVTSLGNTKRVQFREPSAKYAIEVGLIGVAAELGMAACVVQALGSSAIELPTGRYKTAGHILADFRKLVREDGVNSEFLVQGIDNPREHRETILNHIIAFQRLISIRAGGLHAGRGLLHEAAVVQANLVSDFLELLAKSSRIRPYLSIIPRCQLYAKERTLIVEDIHRRLQQETGENRALALASLYLVLPDIPNEEPNWLQVLERISVTPREYDITYLMDVLETALPVNLRRVGGVGPIVPVKVSPGDAGAIPIDPQYLRRQYNEISQLWYSDIAIANGRLNEGTLDLPPVQAVLDVFALGLERSGVLYESKKFFTAHESWVHIVSSLVYKGTPGPYWFLVRCTPDLGQLVAQLRRARRYSANFLSNRIDECLYGINAIRNQQQLSRNDSYFKMIIAEIDQAEAQRKKLLEAQERNCHHPRGLPVEYVDALKGVAERREPVGLLLKDLLSNEQVPFECVRYWSGVLARCAMDTDDLASLVIVLSRNELSAAHTDARKAFRRIDFWLHGPPVA